MKAAIKRKWVKALRSGKFKQNRGALSNCERRPNLALCCIGVGAVVTKPNIRISGIGTSKASDIIGLTDEQEAELVRRNDGLGWSFKAIARYIEKHIPATK